MIIFFVLENICWDKFKESHGKFEGINNILLHKSLKI